MVKRESKNSFIFKNKKKEDSVLSSGITVKEINYKDVSLLSNFITSRGTIIPKRVSKLKSKTQRAIAKAIKLARVAALLPFDMKLKF